MSKFTPEELAAKAAWAREYRLKNGDKIRTRCKERYAERREEIRVVRKALYDRKRPILLAQSKVLRDKHPERYRDYRLRGKYNITSAEFAAMRERQNDACAICEAPFRKTPKVDHCHFSGHVRGLLCSLCNTGLGQFRDNSERLERAAEYIRKHNRPKIQSSAA